MKRLICFVFVLLFSSILIACAQPTQTPTPIPSGEMINLGDEIDGMLFTTTEERDKYLTFNAYCGWDPKEKTETTADFECAAAPGDRIIFGNCVAVWGDDTKDLDEGWGKLKNDEIIFDGKNINLSSFGTQDFTTYFGKPARSWNVIVENIAPGDHTIQCKWEFEGVYYEGNIVITVPSETEDYPTLSSEVTPGQHPYTSEKANLNYFLYIPEEYTSKSQEEWPLILSLHGLEEGAMNSMDVLENLLLKTPENMENFPFIIVSPQGTQEYAEYEIWASDEIDGALLALLDEIQAMIAIDINRIYLTGNSAGGNGTWVIGLHHPDRFAALVPVMGYYGWPFSVPENICDLKGVPVWAFHGAEDETVPLDAEQMLVDALEACDGDVKFTVFPDVGHDLNLEDVYTAELYAWLLEQEKE